MDGSWGSRISSTLGRCTTARTWSKRAGIEPPETWDQVRAAAKALDHPPDVYGIGTSNGNPSGGYD